MSKIVGQIREAVGALHLPEGYFISIEGQFEAQERATRLIGGLSLISLALIFMVLYSRYKSARLAAMIMGNICLLYTSRCV